MNRREFVGAASGVAIAALASKSVESERVGNKLDPLPNKTPATLKLTMDDVIDCNVIGEYRDLIEIQLVTANWQERIGRWLSTEMIRVELNTGRDMVLVDAYVNEIRLEPDVITLKVWAT